VRQLQLSQVLDRHTFVWRKHDYFIYLQARVKNGSLFQVMPELRNIYVHDKRFAAASSAHKSQFIHVFGFKRFYFNRTLTSFPYPFRKVV
jgi:hypothetical protein